jgi:hypothetical protein
VYLPVISVRDQIVCWTGDHCCHPSPHSQSTPPKVSEIFYDKHCMRYARMVYVALVGPLAANSSKPACTLYRTLPPTHPHPPIHPPTQRRSRHQSLVFRQSGWLQARIPKGHLGAPNTHPTHVWGCTPTHPTPHHLVPLPQHHVGTESEPYPPDPQNTLSMFPNRPLQP